MPIRAGRLAHAWRLPPMPRGARRSSGFPSKAARSSSTCICASCPTSPPGRAPIEPHHYGQINAPLTKDEWKAGYAAARRGELPEHLWCELYFQSVHDATVAPAGTHTMSVFAQYVPYTLCAGRLGHAAAKKSASSRSNPWRDFAPTSIPPSSMRRCWARPTSRRKSA